MAVAVVTISTICDTVSILLMLPINFNGRKNVPNHTAQTYHCVNPISWDTNAFNRFPSTMIIRAKWCIKKNMTKVIALTKKKIKHSISNKKLNVPTVPYERHHAVCVCHCWMEKWTEKMIKGKRYDDNNNTVKERASGLHTRSAHTSSGHFNLNHRL